jgi:hypothetical protein
MARTLPLYLLPGSDQVTASSAAPVSTSPVTNGEPGVMIVGIKSGLESPGGMITLMVRDGSDMGDPVVFMVELDFTSSPEASVYPDTPIPCFNGLSFTAQADATANGKQFFFALTLQKIAVQR